MAWLYFSILCLYYVLKVFKHWGQLENKVENLQGTWIRYGLESDLFCHGSPCVIHDGNIDINCREL